MARGESGRIVIEVEPEMKRRLYAALALSGSTLKDWFVKTAEGFCSESVQPSLFAGHGGIQAEGDRTTSRDQRPHATQDGTENE